MSQFRKRIQIVLDGRTIDLVTSARDFASAEVGDDTNAMDSVIRLAHAACLRLKVSGIPTDVDTFADLLDDFVDLEKGDTADTLDEVEPDPIRTAV